MRQKGVEPLAVSGLGCHVQAGQLAVQAFRERGEDAIQSCLAVRWAVPGVGGELVLVGVGEFDRAGARPDAGRSGEQKPDRSGSGGESGGGAVQQAGSSDDPFRFGRKVDHRLAGRGEGGRRGVGRAEGEVDATGAEQGGDGDGQR